MARTKPGRRSDMSAAQNKMSKALKNEGTQRDYIKGLKGSDRREGDARNSRVDVSMRKAQESWATNNSGKERIADTVRSVNRAKESNLESIANQVVGDARKKADRMKSGNGMKNTGAGGPPKTRDRRAAALKAAQTRKMRGGGAGRK